MGELHAQNGYGDTKTVWDADNPDEVNQARRTYNDLIKKNFLAFSVGRRGKKDEQIDEFDPDAEQIIMCPQMKGGI